jgi:transposase
LVGRRCSSIFAGDTIDIFDSLTGEAHAMKLFVAAMGASNYTYAEACPSESLSDWIGAHTNLFTSLRAGSVAVSRPTITSRSTAIGIPPLIG